MDTLPERRDILAKLVQIAVHNSALFLPFHRYLILLYEASLRDLCHYEFALP